MKNTTAEVLERLNRLGAPVNLLPTGAEPSTTGRPIIANVAQLSAAAAQFAAFYFSNVTTNRPVANLMGWLTVMGWLHAMTQQQLLAAAENLVSRGYSAPVNGTCPAGRQLTAYGCVQTTYEVIRPPVVPGSNQFWQRPVPTTYETLRPSPHPAPPPASPRIDLRGLGAVPTTLPANLAVAAPSINDGQWTTATYGDVANWWQQDAANFWQTITDQGGNWQLSLAIANAFNFQGETVVDRLGHTWRIFYAPSSVYANGDLAVPINTQGLSFAPAPPPPGVPMWWATTTLVWSKVNLSTVFYKHAVTRAIAPATTFETIRTVAPGSNQFRQGPVNQATSNTNQPTLSPSALEAQRAFQLQGRKSMNGSTWAERVGSKLVGARRLGAATGTAPAAAAGAGQPLQAAASNLDARLQSSGAPAYTSGQGPSNTTVLAFQTAWNADPIGTRNGNLQTDGEYGTQTQAAMATLGYSEPAPNVVGATPGSVTLPTVVIPGSVPAPGAPGAPGGAGGAGGAGAGSTIFGVPSSNVLAVTAIAAVALVAVATLNTKHGKTVVRHVKTHAHRVHHAVRRHAHRLHPRRR